jgi:hypothetical protein
MFPPVLWCSAGRVRRQAVPPEVVWYRASVFERCRIECQFNVGKHNAKMIPMMQQCGKACCIIVFFAIRRCGQRDQTNKNLLGFDAIIRESLDNSNAKQLKINATGCIVMRRDTFRVAPRVVPPSCPQS